MYIPTPFRVEDRKIVEAFMRRFEFATLVTHSDPSGLTASHVPVLIRQIGADLHVVGHVARGNAQWQVMDGETESLVIFHGPHAYVSPTWYATSPAVPTWNYAVVHAYGRPEAREDTRFTAGVVEELTHRYEGSRERGWSPDAMPPETYAKRLDAIVGFDMPVIRCEAKFKLGQNRSVEDRAGTVAGLEREMSPAARELATFMRAYAGDLE